VRLYCPFRFQIAKTMMSREPLQQAFSSRVGGKEVVPEELHLQFQLVSKDIIDRYVQVKEKMKK
jgi:hypothetical protein